MLPRIFVPSNPLPKDTPLTALIDNIALANSASKRSKTGSPIPIGKLFVGDKKLGGFEEPDSNTIEWSFFPNWSDKFYIIKRETLDFNPLTDWVNVASAGA